MKRSNSSAQDFALAEKSVRTRSANQNWFFRHRRTLNDLLRDTPRVN